MKTEPGNWMKTRGNSARRFVEECCVMSRDARCCPPEMYRMYSSWCAGAGINEKDVFGRNAFYEQLVLNYPIRWKRTAPFTGGSFFGIMAKDGMNHSALDRVAELFDGTRDINPSQTKPEEDDK